MVTVVVECDGGGVVVVEVVPPPPLYHHQSGDGSKITVIWGIFWHQPGNFDTCTAGGAGDKYEVWLDLIDSFLYFTFKQHHFFTVLNLFANIYQLFIEKLSWKRSLSMPHLVLHWKDLVAHLRETPMM